LTSPESLRRMPRWHRCVLPGMDALAGRIWPALERIAINMCDDVFFFSPPPRSKRHIPFFQQPNSDQESDEQIERMIEAPRLTGTFLRPGMLRSTPSTGGLAQIATVHVVAGIPQCPHGPDRRVVIHCGSRGASRYVTTGTPGEYVLLFLSPSANSSRISTSVALIGPHVAIRRIPPEEAQRGIIRNHACVHCEECCSMPWSAGRPTPPSLHRTVAEITGTPARTFSTGPPIMLRIFRPQPTRQCPAALIPVSQRRRQQPICFPQPSAFR